MNRRAANLLVAALLAGALSVDALGGERTRNERTGHAKDLQEIRASRSVIKRIERDPQAPADVTQQAVELDRLLDVRERVLARLDTQYQTFLSQHQTELDELNDLRARARAIDQRLGEAREGLVQATRSEIEELIQGSRQVQQLIEGLRRAYDIDRQARRKR